MKYTIEAIENAKPGMRWEEIGCQWTLGQAYLYSLIETIAKFEELGCTLDGIVKVKERYTHFGSDEHALIPAFKMTVKEA